MDEPFSPKPGDLVQIKKLTFEIDHYHEYGYVRMMQEQHLDILTEEGVIVSEKNHIIMVPFARIDSVIEHLQEARNCLLEHGKETPADG